MEPFLTRGRVCNLLLLLGLASAVPIGPVPRDSRPCFVFQIFETSPTWRARSLAIHIPRNRVAQLYPRAHGLLDEHVEIEDTLRLTVSQSVSQYVLVSSPLWDLWTDITAGRLLSESCDLVHVRRPLWREGGSAVCSVITKWSESRRTRTILYCLIWDSPNLESQVPVLISSRNRVVQL
jgi:hypothetical protein